MADPWRDDENELVIRRYFELVDHELQGRSVQKTSLYRSIAEETGREPKAVEFKFLNVSGALASLGLGHASGLRPYGNFQGAMLPIVERWLTERPDLKASLGHSTMPPKQPVRLAARERVLHEAALAAPPAIHSSEDAMKVTELWRFATGGTEVAAMPGQGNPDQTFSMPQGPRPAAVEEAIEWMRGAINGSTTRARRFLFFVGGPGGGKSDAASALVSGLPLLTDVSDGLAHRSYSYDSPGGKVLLVNDATIPARGDSTQTLAEDLDSADASQIIACVNRGVLVDEVYREPTTNFGSKITSWLRGGSLDTEDDPKTEASIDTPYLKQGRLQPDGSPPVELLAVYVDVCSLLERRPRVTTTDIGLTGAPYGIARFRHDTPREGTPAGQLLGGVLARIIWAKRSAADPVAANLQSLAHASTRNGLLSVLRAAELGSTQRFAYRQIWGLLTRAIAGPLPEQINHAQLDHWLDTEVPAVEASARTRFDQMKRLAQIRLHESIFGADWESSSRHPVLSATSRVDPSRDMLPGMPADPSPGWATPVSEAFSGAELGAAPLEGLLASANTQELRDYVTPFDSAVDKAFVDALEKVEDGVWRSGAISWYGRYLTRMLAVAHGYAAFSDQLYAWTFAWEMCPNLQQELRPQLETLLRPSRHGGTGGAQVPLFGSRSEAVFGTPAAPMLVVEMSDLKLSTAKHGEELLLEVKRGDTELGAVVLDLDLIREATASSRGWLGLTDATETVVPRLERFRSLNLVPGKLDQNAVKVITREADFNLSAVPTTGDPLL